jgi:hypothetical protein
MGFNLCAKQLVAANFLDSIKFKQQISVFARPEALSIAQSAEWEVHVVRIWSNDPVWNGDFGERESSRCGGPKFGTWNSLCQRNLSDSDCNAARPQVAV